MNNPYEFRRLLCTDCKEIFSNEEALKEDVPNAIRLSCPFCLSYKHEEITVCECEREECVPGEDLGRACLAAEADAMADVTLEQIDERRPKSELSLLCAEIAMAPYRRSA